MDKKKSDEPNMRCVRTGRTVESCACATPSNVLFYLFYRPTLIITLHCTSIFVDRPNDHHHRYHTAENKWSNKKKFVYITIL